MVGPSGSFAVVDPRTGATAGRVVGADVATVAQRAAAAQRAAPAWAAVAPADRAEHVSRIVDAWRAHLPDLVDAVRTELGQPDRFTRTVHVENPIKGAEVLVDLAASIEWTRSVDAATVHRHAVGVVAALTPWNYPIHQVIAKAVPALLAGCTVVLKPSELAPLSADLLVRTAAPLLPAGALSIVQGDGAVVGDALVRNPAVDLVSFTGSADVGRSVAAAAALAGTPTLLELGGRSPAVLLDDLPDAAFERAVRFVAADAMSNAGQTCNALSRLVVPRSRLAAARSAAVGAARRFVPGEQLGPVRRARDVQRLADWVAAVEAAGARVLLDGRGAQGPDGGFWFGPTVVDLAGVAHVAGADAGARDEVFGPVLTIEPYDDAGADLHARDTAARATAFAPSLGLSAAVWADDVARAEAVAAGLRAGQVRINGARWDFRLPFGGFGAAGWGREWGREGIEAFTTLRVVAR
jgi:acyl-CoA reductase-like NAD-dependent aldehyde dehydrogenase